MKCWKECGWFFLALNFLIRAAALPSLEPFSDATSGGGTAYASGSPLFHQTNASGESWAQWNGGTTTSSILCTNAGLNYIGFPTNFPPPPPANAVYIPGNLDHSGGVSGLSAALVFSRAIAADPAGLATNTIYASFLLRICDLGTLNSGGPTYFGGFATNSGDQAVSLPASALKIFLKGNSATSGKSTSWAIGVADNSGGGSAMFDGGGHGTNDVVFVVVAYEFGVHGNADVAKLWVNPDSANFGDVFPPAPTARTAGITGTNRIARAADFFLLDRTGSTLWGGLMVGSLRLGTSWSFVTGGREIINFARPTLALSASGTRLNLTGTNGLPGATNILLSATNLALPLSNWTTVATNLFDANGRFSLVTMPNPGAKQYYLLQCLPVPNPLWIPECGALLGAACTNGTAAAVSALEAQIGRQNDVLRIYHTPGNWSKLTSDELAFINAGRKLLFSVKPDSQWSNAVGVANGGSATVDSQMTSLAKSIAAVQPAKVMLIVWHEPENDVIGSVPNAKAGTTAQYVQMWHNVRSIFDANGATNVIWVWDIENYAPLRYLTPALWPGNTYVDWVMWDQYQDSATDPYTNVLEDGYTYMTTNSTLANDYLGKPWGVAEWGVGINSYIPTAADQTNGVSGLTVALNQLNLFPKLKLVEYFDEGASALQPAAVAVYSNFANSPYMEQQCSP